MMIMQSPSLCHNVLLELKKGSPAMKKTALYFFSNLVFNSEDHKVWRDKLVKMNLLGVLHDELTEKCDDPVLTAMAIETLRMMFLENPTELQRFLHTYGPECIEQHAYSRHQAAAEVARRFLKEFQQQMDGDESSETNQFLADPVIRQ